MVNGYTLNSSESIWPTPFSTGVHWNQVPSPEGQRNFSFSVDLASVLWGGAAPPWRFCRSAHVQNQAPHGWRLMLPKGAAEVFLKYTEWIFMHSMPHNFLNFHILTDSIEQAKLDTIHCCQVHWWPSCEGKLVNKVLRPPFPFTPLY